MRKAVHHSGNYITLVYIVWFIMGLIWNGEYSPRHDENDYLTGAKQIIEGNYDSYTLGRAGTLVRPYLYPLFLSIILIFHEYFKEMFTFLPDVNIRYIIAPVQAYLFLKAVNSLAEAGRRFGQPVTLGIRLGLLCQPFLAFLMSDLLADTLSIIIWIIISSFFLRNQNLTHFSNLRGLVRTFGLGCLLGALVVTRSANIPAAFVGFAVVYVIAQRRFLRVCYLAVGSLPRLKRSALITGVNLGMFIGGLTFMIIPQAMVMNHRLELAGEPETFWGAGSAVTSYGVFMLKYTTAANLCGDLIPAAVQYDNPFGVSELELVWIQQGVLGLVLYYAVNPLYALLHVFNGINYDFPTTYIMSWNIYSNRLFNLVSAMILAVAVAGAVVRGSAGLGVIPHLDRRYGFGLVVVSCCVGVSALQLTIISVENRYGVVLWSWLSAWSGIVLTSVVAPASVWRRAYFAIVCGMLVVGILLLSEWVLAQSSIVSKAYILGC